ncbi:MAG: sulfotransferase [Acidothermales bacterium]|nr:sulfotransferase [Acidothermales bacterium]
MRFPGEIHSAQAQAMTGTAAPERMPSPIFIVGSMGSGSTLLRLILDSHDHIAIGQETSFMRLVLAHRWVPFWRFGDKWHGRLGLTEEDLDAELRDFYGGLFERYARQQGKRRWGEKTPHHVWHAAAMAKLFPDSVFLGIVRHPGGTTGSLMSRFRFEASRGVAHWLRANRELVNQGARLGERFLLCRYEDLVLEPEKTLRELFDWLDEPWQPQVLQHHEVQRDKGAPQVVDGRTRSDDPVDTERVAKWMTGLDVDDRELLRREAGAWADFFGYDVDGALPTGPLAPPQSTRERLITGTELAARREAGNWDVDFTPPARPENERLYKPQRKAGAATPTRVGQSRRPTRPELESRTKTADRTPPAGHAVRHQLRRARNAVAPHVPPVVRRVLRRIHPRRRR